MDQIPSPHVLYSYNVPSKSDVWDTQTLVSTNPFYPCSIIPHCLEIILLYFSFKRVFGTSLTEQTGAIDQDPQNSAGKYFMDKNYSKSLCYFMLQSYLNLPFIIFMQLYLQGTFGNQFLDLTFCKVLNDLFLSLFAFSSLSNEIYLMGNLMFNITYTFSLIKAIIDTLP